MEQGIATRSPPERQLALFWQGASQPALPALLIALGVVSCACALFFMLLDEDVLAGPAYKYFMTNDLDTQTLITHRVLAAQPSVPNLVVNLGTSVMVRCAGKADALTDTIAALTGERPTVYNLMTDGQSAWEMAAIIDRLPSGSSGTVVIGLTPGLLGGGLKDLRTNIEQPKLGFTSRVLDEEARQAGISVPERTGIYAFDNSYYLLSHRHAVISNIFRGPQSYGDPLSAPWMKKVHDPEFWKTEIAGLPKTEEKFDTNHSLTLEAIGRMIIHLRKKGDFSILLVEAPINPGWHKFKAGKVFFEKYRKILEDFSSGYRLRFVSITERAQLKQTDFVDYEGHIGTAEAQKRCARALSEIIAGELKH